MQAKITMSWKDQPWSGVFPATLCPFHDDQTIDEEGLREYVAELAAVDGVEGLTCNGHTGEIMWRQPEGQGHLRHLRRGKC
jgi:dihydrodipicolinate synthase/N-acetylneuraminate lyase